MSDELKTVPSDYVEIDLGMSNCDHTIDDGLEEKLKSGKFRADYSGWNFNGNVWFEDDKFHCEVWRYKCHSDTISADSLREIMEDVSDEYGWK